MKRGRPIKIVLRNKFLRNLRKNLRIVLLLAYDDRIRWYWRQRNEIERNSSLKKSCNQLGAFENEWHTIIGQYEN